MSHDDTRGAALLAIAADTLAEAVVPALTGEARFRALMTLSAVRMVQRELEQADALAAAAPGAPGALAEAIRAGRHDGCAELHARLSADAAARTRVSRPEALAEGSRGATPAGATISGRTRA
jgi:hypothetical protein